MSLTDYRVHLLRTTGLPDLHYARICNWDAPLPQSIPYSGASMSKVQLRYQINDGYAGGARPQYLMVTLDDIEDCETEDQVRDRLYEFAEKDMRSRIGVSIRNEDEVIAMWQRSRDNGEAPHG